jgi:hypothetical protein
VENLSNLTDNEKKYGITITGLYKSKSGKSYSATINEKPKKGQRDIAEIADFLANGAGGKFVIEFVKEETKEEKGDTFPDAFLKFVTAESAAEQKAEWKSKANKF